MNHFESSRRSDSRKQRDNVNIHPLERTLSTVGGAYLALSGLRRGFGKGKVRMLLGAELLRRGMSGYCHGYKAMGIDTSEMRASDVLGGNSGGAKARVNLTIRRPRHEVYGFWREFGNLATVMRHLVSVKDTGNGISTWTAEGPLGKQVSWEARVVEDVENERIRWESLPGGQVETAGTVEFADAPQGFGTEVRVELRYQPPAGIVGAYGAKLFGRDAQSTMEADCWRLKEYLETGEIATTEGQAKGPSNAESRRRRMDSELGYRHGTEASA